MFKISKSGEKFFCSFHLLREKKKYMCEKFLLSDWNCLFTWFFLKLFLVYWRLKIWRLEVLKFSLFFL